MIEAFSDIFQVFGRLRFIAKLLIFVLGLLVIIEIIVNDLF